MPTHGECRLENLSDRIDTRRIVQQALADWRAQGRLASQDMEAVWQASLPTRADWRGWLDRALLILGAALICAGVIVFFAFNWAALHKFARFGLLAVALTALAGFAMSRPAVRAVARPMPGPDADTSAPPAVRSEALPLAGSSADLPGLAALGAAQILSGVLMAVIGQTYQTGADAWQLFAWWTVLAVPWALAARAAPHWWIVLVVGNVALLRYGSVNLGVGGMLELLFSADRAGGTMRILLAAAVAQLALWYALAARASDFGFRGMTGPRLIGLLICGYAGWIGLLALVGTRLDELEPLMNLLLAGVALAALIAWFRWRDFDIVVLSFACLTAIGVIVTAVGRWLLAVTNDIGGFLLLTLIVVGLAAFAGSWLMRAWRSHAAGADATAEGTA